MQSFILTLRAVGARFALRLYIPAVIIVMMVLAFIIGGGIWLTTLDAWWWLLFIPITMLFCVVAAIAVIIFMVINFVRPEQTTFQKKAVGQFVDKIQSASDIAGTPKFIILFRVVRSIAAPSKDTYLSDLASTGKLAKDFRELQTSFSDARVIK